MIQNLHKITDISIFGSTGFIGNNFCSLFPKKTIQVPRNSRMPMSDNVLYFISTTDNFNIFDNPKKDIETNLMILIETLQNCKNKGIVFNFVSSWYVYGNVPVPVPEHSTCEPKGFYSITKKCAEDLLVSFCETFNIPYRILRLSNVYGAGDKRASVKKNALQFLTSRLINNEPIHLYDGGKFSRDYMHIVDVCHAINLILEKGAVNEVYNVGSGEEHQFNTIIDIVATHVGSTSIIEDRPPPDFYRQVQVKNMCLNVSKLHSLGFTCSVSIEEGIKGMCDQLIKEQGDG